MILWPRSTRNCYADSCIGPSDSVTVGCKRNWVPSWHTWQFYTRLQYLLLTPRCWVLHRDETTGQTAVTSHVNCLPPDWGTSVIPSGPFPLIREIPLGFLVTWMLADRSFRLWCLAMCCHVSRCLLRDEAMFSNAEVLKLATVYETRCVVVTLLFFPSRKKCDIRHWFCAETDTAAKLTTKILFCLISLRWKLIILPH